MDKAEKTRGATQETGSANLVSEGTPKKINNVSEFLAEKQNRTISKDEVKNKIVVKYAYRGKTYQISMSPISSDICQKVI